MGAFSVSPVHGLAVVAQGQLREPFGIACHLGPFCLGIPVAMQGHAMNPQADASLLELRSPVARQPAPQVREQRPHLRQGCQDGLHLLTKSNLWGLLVVPPTGLHANKADDPRRPVHVLGLQVGQVRLRSAQVPGQLIERLALGIAFAGDDPASRKRSRRVSG